MLCQAFYIRWQSKIVIKNISFYLPWFNQVGALDIINTFDFTRPTFATGS